MDFAILNIKRIVDAKAYQKRYVTYLAGRCPVKQQQAKCEVQLFDVSRVGQKNEPAKCQCFVIIE